MSHSQTQKPYHKGLHAVSATLLFICLAFAPHAQAKERLLTEAWVKTIPAKEAPDLIYQDLTTQNDHKLSEKRGGWVLLNIWATWCGPCTKEMPKLQTLQQKMTGQPFHVLALSEDQQGPAAVASFLQRHSLTNVDAGLDATGVAPSRLHAPGLPYSVLIDPEGRETGHVAGPVDWSSPENIAYLQELLHASP